jgi:hypothetical protein
MIPYIRMLWMRLVISLCVLVLGGGLTLEQTHRLTLSRVCLRLCLVNTLPSGEAQVLCAVSDLAVGLLLSLETYHVTDHFLFPALSPLSLTLSRVWS